MIAIIDYDAGNIKSVEKAMQLLGQEVTITRDRETIMNADKVILPGVGAFGDAMGKLRQYGLDEVIRDVTAKGTPFLGICLGLQLLFERSDETPGVEGLGILKGEILRIPDQEGLKIPHMGWNSLKFQNNGRVVKGSPEESYVYFVHSYYLKAEGEKLYECQTGRNPMDKDTVTGLIVENRQKKGLYGIKNVSQGVWRGFYPDGKLKDIPNGQGIPIWNGMSVRFELGEEWNLRLVQQTEERKEDEDEQTV